MPRKGERSFNRLPDGVRSAILADVQAGGASARKIARKHGTSETTVRKIAGENGLERTWEGGRTRTENASRARMADMKAERAEVAELLLRKSRQLIDRAEEPYTVYAFGGRENTYAEHQLERPPAGEVRSYYTAAAIALDKHVKLVAHDSDAGAGAAASMLSGIAAALSEAAGRSGGDAASSDSESGQG